MNVLILCPYPHGEAPSQRFRFEQYISFLGEQKFVINQQSFLDTETWLILYKPGNGLKKGWGIVLGFINRFFLLFTIFKYDFVFIHREATPVGPPIIEWLIAKVFRKKIIYDFDDAIWLPNTSQENKIAAALKCHSKVKWICTWSYKVSCGNNYLADFAKQFNNNVALIPTTIDTDYHCKIQDERSKTQEESRKTQDTRVKKQQEVDTSDKSDTIPIIGWTGTHSTEKYLQQLVPVLQELEKEHQFIFRVISNHNPQLPLNFFEYLPWNKVTEIDDLSQFDIGVMPLEDDEWASGKCGFKGLQYMALGIPTLMSPVGVNKDIVTHGENGYLASTKNEWREVLIDLITKPELRNRIGISGISTIKNTYSVSANTINYTKLFS